MAKPNPSSRKRKVVVQPVEEKLRRIIDLSLRDRFKIGGVTYVLNSISEEAAEVTQMATGKHGTGYDGDRLIITEYEYGARILQMPLDTKID